MKSQDVVPEFNHCITDTTVICDTSTTEGVLDYEYKPGCILKVQFRTLMCTYPFSVQSWRFEVDGFSIGEDSTACQDLLDSLYPGWRLGNGVLNEIKYRSMIVNIYKFLADYRMKIFAWLVITPQDRATLWKCSQNFPNRTTYPFPRFFTALEGTCMRTCVISYRVYYQDQSIYYQGQSSNHGSVGKRLFFAYKKCYNSCCLIAIEYCWDTSISPNRWKRTITGMANQGDGELRCPDNIPWFPMLEGCKIPIGISLSDIIRFDAGECKQTCPIYLDESEYIDL